MKDPRPTVNQTRKALRVWLLGLYLGYPGVASFYGAIGSVGVLLFWIYYSSMVILWGAEFTCVYSRHRVEGGAGTKSA